MLKIGLLGLGRFGNVHAEAYNVLPQAKVVAVADGNSKRLSLAKEQYGVKCYLTPEELFSKEDDLDVIDICLPTYLHNKYLQMAIAKKCHVFCEKPLALTVEEGKTMLKAATEARIKFAVGHVLRFWPEYLYFRKLLKKGLLGFPLSLMAYRLSGTSATSWNQWMNNPKYSIGVFDMLIHDLDLVRWFFGEPLNFTALGVKLSTGCWGQVNTLLSFDGGIQANLEASFLPPKNYPFTMYLRLIGEEGTLQFNFWGASEIGKSSAPQQELIYFQQNGKIEKVNLPQSHQVGTITSAVASELDYFLNCIYKNEEPEIISGTNALGSLVLASKIISYLSDKNH